VTRCESCGRAVDEHDRHIRYGLPDPVLHAADPPVPEVTWMSHADAGTSVMMQVDGLGAFVRALLPVRLTGGYAVTYGLWIAIHPDDLLHAFEVWWAPEYAQLRLHGRLAHDVPPWPTLGAEVEIAVTDPDVLPYCVTSSDSTLSRVLSEEWEHESVLSTLPA